MEDIARVEELNKLKAENEALKSEAESLRGVVLTLRAGKSSADQTCTDILNQFVAMKAQYLITEDKTRNYDVLVKEKTRLEQEVKDLKLKLDSDKKIQPI